jgi:hypothetical protein
LALRDGFEEGFELSEVHGRILEVLRRVGNPCGFRVHLRCDRYAGCLGLETAGLLAS